MNSIVVGNSELWTAAGVLLGFQITSFFWRIGREVAVSDRPTENGANGTGSATFLNSADYVNLIAMIVLVMGVFILPSLTTS